jgi:6-phosphogluconolactonase
MLASTIAQILGAATAAHGKASLVVSGGTTPGPLFRVLRSIRLPWERVTVVPSDERWVAPDDAASNEAMIRRELLAEHAASANLLSFYRPGLDAEAALPALSSDLAQVKRPFDALHCFRILRISIARSAARIAWLCSGSRACRSRA